MDIIITDHHHHHHHHSNYTTLHYSQTVNGHVYANKPFRKGEIIEIARGLLVPEEAMGGAGHIEEFAWFSVPPKDAAPVAEIGIDQNGDPVLVPSGIHLPGLFLLLCFIISILYIYQPISHEVSKT